MAIRRFISLIIIGALVFAGSSCSNNKNRWAKYSDRVFSVRMPEGPKAYDKVEMTPFGRQTVHYVTWRPASLELNKFKLFQVSYTDCPARYQGDATKMGATLDSSINQRLKDFTELEVRSHPIEINGYHGRAFIYDPPRENVVTIVKQVIANNKRFDLTVIAKRDYPTNAEISNFYNSFQVLR